VLQRWQRPWGRGETAQAPAPHRKWYQGPGVDEWRRPGVVCLCVALLCAEPCRSPGMAVPQGAVRVGPLCARLGHGKCLCPPVGAVGAPGEHGRRVGCQRRPYVYGQQGGHQWTALPLGSIAHERFGGLLGVGGHLREEAAQSCGGAQARPPQSGKDLMSPLRWQVPLVGGEGAITPVREEGVMFSLRWWERHLCRGMGDLLRGRKSQRALRQWWQTRLDGVGTMLGPGREGLVGSLRQQ
jgi:hypothetical protein